MTTVAFFCLSLEGALWEEPIYMTPKLKAKLLKKFYFFLFWDGQLEDVGFGVLFCVFEMHDWVGEVEGYDITENSNCAQQSWSCKNGILASV